MVGWRYKGYSRSSSAPENLPQLEAKLLTPVKRWRPLYQQAVRFARKARFWGGWWTLGRNSIKLLVISAHLALILLLAKCVLFPTADPREEWWPAYWGVPWYPSSRSWADIAAERKTHLARQQEDINSGPSLDPSLLTPSPKARPPRLKYPILWAAPFYSRSGYGTEAISYIAGLLQHGLVAPEDLWITQAGDGRHPDALDGLDPSVRQLLWDQEWQNVTKRLSPADRDRPLIVVCHVFPDCWRTVNDDMTSKYAIVRWMKWLANEIKVRVWGFDREKDNGCPCPNTYIKDRVVYRVGRSMFETERLPSRLVVYADELDEVLVPSDFSVQSFKTSGIPATKLHTLPQGINTTLFDPSKSRAINLAKLNGSQVTGTPRSYNPGGDPVYQKPMGIFDRLSAKFIAGQVQQQLQQIDDVVTDVVTGTHHDHADNAFRFLSVFKWEARKGWDILLKGFFQEFSPEENVELHVVTHAFGTKVDDFRTFMRDAIKKVMNVTDEDMDKRMSRVYVYDKYIPDSMYPGLYQAMNALVVPTHGEGWGRPQFEAMAMGLPVISTNWSGLTAFMDDKVSYPIPVEALVEVDDPSPEAFYWFKQQRWAQPSMTEMRKLMRRVVTHREEAARRGEAAKHRIQTEYSILAVARKALIEISRIEERVERLMGSEHPGSHGGFTATHPIHLGGLAGL